MAGEKVVTPGHKTFGPRRHKRLTKARVAKLVRDGTNGRHTDGDGLSLRIVGGSASWNLTFRFKGARREMPLGSAYDMDLEAARQAAEDEHRTLRREKRDPLAHRAARRAKAAGEKAFFQVAELFIEEMQAKGRDKKTVAQASMWLLGRMPDGRKTKINYCAPLHAMPIGAIASDDVIRVLDPIWRAKKAETGDRLRGKIEQVLAFGAVRGFAGEAGKDKPNVARWKGNLEHALAAKSDVAQVEHFRSRPYADMPAFIAELRKRKGMGAPAVEFQILTTARPGNVRGMRAGEINLEAKTWTIPAAVLKTKTTRTGDRPHIVPLSARALELIAPLLEGKAPDALVFPGLRGRPMSDMTLGKVLKSMDVDATVHGFRATFTTWAKECTHFDEKTIEAALSHAEGDKVEAAYMRGDMLAKRRPLMTAWANFVEGVQPDNVVTMPR
jgi:integrase